ncbi:hypothetical protein C7E18_00235 [Stenotrophomonas maltophilia]|uniref:Lipoprotein n=1 Tax=Stenotrophomonas sepilia TaxID=2860290 RepID=A0ABQ6QEX4_9GAMM|nr:hypothetical protein C7E18_00235 [Stenotrophomonas maltophilia]GMR28750.1 hypothetical protein STENOSP10_29710 [Stenotrophomonas sepilia]
MTRIILAVHLVAAALLLAGCDKPEPAEATGAAQPEQTIGGDIEAKTGKPAFRYVDPREGYKKRPDLCSVPPCDSQPAAAPAPAQKKTDNAGE